VENIAGLPIAPNGITLLTDHLGRTNGQAFVQFSTPDLVEKALERHKATIGRRFVCLLILQSFQLFMLFHYSDFLLSKCVLHVYN
jgi:hypothetical protein